MGPAAGSAGGHFEKFGGKFDFPGKQHVFRYFSVRLRRRDVEKRKTPYVGSTRVLGEPAAILYRLKLGSIINHWDSRNKKVR